MENGNHLEPQNIQKNAMDNSKTVRISPYMHEKKIRETLEITSKKTINEKDKTFTVLNKGNGD